MDQTTVPSRLKTFDAGARAQAGLSILLTIVFVLPCRPAFAQTGVRISLPICDRHSIPANFSMRELPSSSSSTSNGSGPLTYTPPWVMPAACGTSLRDCAYSFSVYPTVRTTFIPVDTMDWRGGNNARYVHDAECINPFRGILGRQDHHLRLLPSAGDPSLQYDSLLDVTGFISNVTGNVQVFGQVVYGMRASTAPLLLAVQVQQSDSSWADVSTTLVSTCDVDVDTNCDRRVAEISAFVPSNSNVRLELRVAPSANDDDKRTIDLSIYEATLFGAECFPDAANPGMCLQ